MGCNTIAVMKKRITGRKTVRFDWLEELGEVFVWNVAIYVAETWIPRKDDERGLGISRCTCREERKG